MGKTRFCWWNQKLPLHLKISDSFIPVDSKWRRYQWGEINSVGEKDICRRIGETTTSLLKLISDNFEITMKEITNIKSEVNELKKHRIYRGGSWRKSSEYAEES